MADQYGITNLDAYRIFALLVGDVVLGLIPQQEVQQVLEGRLPGLSASMSAGLTAAILTYAAPVQEPSTTPAAPTPPPAANLQSEISDLEETVSHLEPVRTMASDMHAHAPVEEVAHTTSQDHILEYQEIEEGPSWETDSSS
jgi:hypothetical protein